MQWTSTIATEPGLGEAVDQAAEKLFKGLGGQEPDLVLAFASSGHAAELDALPRLLKTQFDSAFVFGCCGNGVIGGGAEIEDRPALALTAAHLPGVRLHGAHLAMDDLPPVYAERRFWEDRLSVGAADARCFLLLADPFSFATDAFLRGLDRAYPGVPKIGGLAAAAPKSGATALFLDGKVHHSGLVSLAMSGDVEMHAMVAQGSRPIGEPMFVTAAHDNIIRELDGRVPRELLTELFERLPREDRRLFGQSLFIGLAISGERTEYAAGDFLVRNILGLDPQSGALWVGGRVEQQSVVQLHLRDVVSAAQDLEQSLRGCPVRRPGDKAADADGLDVRGALLFSCVSRGSAFYGQPDHDSDAFRRIVADVPLGGFFCGGEIGPVQGATHLHGHTSAFGLIAPRRKT